MSLERSPVKRRQPVRRYWEDAYEKIRRQYVCRYCKRGEVFDPTLSGCIYDLHMGEDRIEAAHVIGRGHDETRVGPRGGRYIYVDPDAVIPLCSPCHRRQHEGKVDLTGKLTLAELRYAIKKIGKGCARRKITGRRDA